ncbi:hypothetical protein Halha_0972 [Halobacteroides halobius DSM 5150]|uniref:Uncharacterized protein n=1 Tax=Halobacteroides halobius (strain ATCC 35273 / DSM 5150 / MD-1) TaxID=748449 RepID=L0KA03_HALHC|nr:hypothetical protein [Halobacteroides halobius]AGB40933.1 hypothetical protein Halha_0972 [Halobacteroides halobius DSM 5150]
MNFLFILSILVSLIFGYFLGRFLGYKRGFKEGFFAAPLIYRQQSLQQGNCLLCNNKMDNFSLKEEKS